MEDSREQFTRTMTAGRTSLEFQSVHLATSAYFLSTALSLEKNSRKKIGRSGYPGSRKRREKVEAECVHSALGD